MATQGVNLLTGQQRSFSWSSLAASALSAGIAQGLTSGLTGDGGVFGASDAATKLAVNSTTRALVSAATRVAIQGGKVSWEAVAADALSSTVRGMYGSGGGSGSGSQQPNAQVAQEDNQYDLGVTGSGAQSRVSDSDLNAILSGQRDLLAGERYQLAANDTGTMSDAGNGLIRRTDQLQIGNVGESPEDRAINSAADYLNRNPDSRMDMPTLMRAFAQVDGLPADTTASDAGELAYRFGKGFMHGAVDMVWQPIANTIDLGQAAVGYASGGRYEPTWLSAIGQNAEAGMPQGEIFARAALGSNPVTGVGLATFDLTGSVMRGDWGGVAEGAGNLAGGFTLAKGGQRAFAPEPGAALGAYRLQPQVEVVTNIDGLANLPGGEAANFKGLATPIRIGDQPLSRVFVTTDMDAQGAKPNGGYWSDRPYSNEAAWRSGAAVQEGWNTGNLQGTWKPEPQWAWSGKAAPQAIKGYSDEKWGLQYGWIHKGGDAQIYVPNSRSVISPSEIASQPTPWSKR